MFIWSLSGPYLGFVWKSCTFFVEREKKKTDALNQVEFMSLDFIQQFLIRHLLATHRPTPPPPPPLFFFFFFNLYS
jgi:hypothetical protein